MHRGAVRLLRGAAGGGDVSAAAALAPPLAAALLPPCTTAARCRDGVRRRVQRRPASELWQRPTQVQRRHCSGGGYGQYAAYRSGRGDGPGMPGAGTGPGSMRHMSGDDGGTLAGIGNQSGEVGPKAEGGGMFGMGIRENFMRGREWMSEESEHDRPKFDFMGKLMEWAQSKDVKQTSRLGKGHGYFMLDFLVDMEGYPEEMREGLEEIEPEEHLMLRLASMSEERRFWKSFFFYQEQYEFENKMPTGVLDISQTHILEYCLRKAGVASPFAFQAFRESLFDDNSIIFVDHKCKYERTNLPEDVKNNFTGRSLGFAFGDSVPRSGIHALTREIAKLRRFPVEVRDLNQEVTWSGVVSYRDGPTLELLLRYLQLEGSYEGEAAHWFIDVRDFYSTPGHMIFTDWDYHSFLLDWWFAGKWMYDGAQCGTSRVVIYPRQTYEQRDEAKRGWFHVL